MTDIEAKIKQLRDELNRHNYNYYVLNQPTIGDMEFDFKMHELEDLERRTPNLPTRSRPHSVWVATSVRGSSKCFTNALCRASATPIPLRRCKTFCAVPKTVWAASPCRLWAK